MKASIDCVTNHASKASWLIRPRKKFNAAHAVSFMILTVLFLAIKPSGASVDPVIEQFLLNDQTLEMRVLPRGKATTGPDAFGASASHAQNIDWQLTDYSRDAFIAASGLLAFHFIDTTIAHAVQVCIGRTMLTKN